MKIGFSKQLIQEFLGQSSDSGLTAIPIKGDQSKSVASKAEISFSDLQLMMTQIWKDVLGYQEITEEANFFDIGGDSISAVKLIHLSKVQLQGEFVVADLYSHPTLLDFCQFAFAKLYPSEQQDPIAKLLEQIDSGLLDPKRL
jgi:aryl carrier-like protein